MPAAFTIRNHFQKQQLINGLRRQVHVDCVKGRRFLDENAASGEARELGPVMVATLRKNIDIREAVYNDMIRKLEARSDDPIAMDDYFNQIMLSFANPNLPEDPVKREYSKLVLDMVPGDKLPKALIDAVGPLPEGQSVRGFVPLSRGEATAENIRLIEMRAVTIERIMHVLFDEFFKAGTGQREIPPHSPEYRRFADQMEKMLGMSGGRGGPG